MIPRLQLPVPAPKRKRSRSGLGEKARQPGGVPGGPVGAVAVRDPEDIPSAEQKALAELVAGSRTNSWRPVRWALPSTSVITPAAVSSTIRARELGADDAAVEEGSGEPVVVEEREPRRGAAPARRAVDLAVGEDGHVPLDERRPSLSCCQKMTP